MLNGVPRTEPVEPDKGPDSGTCFAAMYSAVEGSCQLGV